MGHDQKPLDLAGLIKTLRYITTAVQIMPFIYTILYIISLAVSLFAPDLSTAGFVIAMQKKDVA